jgi:uncharacterized protein GlcG (DUF336 family)
MNFANLCVTPVILVKATEAFIACSDVTMKQAQAVLEAALNKAKEINTKMDIAVVDVGTNLKAFIRMDEAWIGSVDIAIKKAKTARFFDMPTGEIGNLSQPGGPLYNIEHTNGGLITFPGGVPLKNSENEIIGAIGVSGSTVENDHTVAEAGAGAISEISRIHKADRPLRAKNTSESHSERFCETCVRRLQGLVFVILMFTVRAVKNRLLD